jgi:hypothetical protein
MQLYEQVDGVQTRADLAQFVAALREDLLDHPESWENATLERFLDAFEGWVTDMHGFFANVGEQMPAQPSWNTVARMLLAAKGYE